MSYVAFGATPKQEGELVNVQPTQPMRNHPWQPSMLLLVFVLPVVFAVIYFNLATNAFYLLELTPNAALLVVIGSLVGSMINIRSPKPTVLFHTGRQRVWFLLRRGPFHRRLTTTASAFLSTGVLCVRRTGGQPC